MRVVERTSVSAYYASTKSSIHIPIDSKFDESLLNWLTQRNFANLVNTKSDESINNLCSLCIQAGFVVSKELVIEHVEFIKDREQKTSGNYFFIDADD
jgi:hypothetical protein